MTFCKRRFADTGKFFTHFKQTISCIILCSVTSLSAEDLLQTLEDFFTRVTNGTTVGSSWGVGDHEYKRRSNE